MCSLVPCFCVTDGVGQRISSISILSNLLLNEEGALVHDRGILVIIRVLKMLSPSEQWPSGELGAGDAPNLKSHHRTSQQVICIFRMESLWHSSCSPMAPGQLSLFLCLALYHILFWQGCQLSAHDISNLRHSKITCAGLS